MKKTSITPKIKNGTICTLTDNPLVIFRVIDKNYHLGYPIADVCMFRGEFTAMGGKQTVAYTNRWQEASPEQKDTWNTELKRLQDKYPDRKSEYFALMV